MYLLKYQIVLLTASNNTLKTFVAGILGGRRWTLRDIFTGVITTRISLVISLYSSFVFLHFRLKLPHNIVSRSFETQSHTSYMLKHISTLELHWTVKYEDKVRLCSTTVYINVFPLVYQSFLCTKHSVICVSSTDFQHGCY